MTLDLSIQLALWSIITIQTLLLVFVNVKLDRSLEEKQGIPIGETIPQLKYITLEGVSNSLQERIKRVSSCLICTVHPGCPVCEKVIKYLSLIPIEDLKKVILITFGDTKEVLKWIEKIEPFTDFNIFKEEDITQRLRITAYPFGMVVDNEGKVLTKGFLSKDSMRMFLESLNTNVYN